MEAAAGGSAGWRIAILSSRFDPFVGTVHRLPHIRVKFFRESRLHRRVRRPPRQRPAGDCLCDHRALFGIRRSAATAEHFFQRAPVKATPALYGSHIMPSVTRQRAKRGCRGRGRENVRVVDLSNADQFTVHLDRREGTARAHQRSPSVQRSKSAGVASDLRRWIRQRKNHWTRSVTRHLAHNLLGKRSRLRAHAGQHRDSALRTTSSSEMLPESGAVSFHPATSSRLRRNSACPDFIPSQPSMSRPRVEGVNPFARLFSVKPSLFHRRDEKIDDADASRSVPNIAMVCSRSGMPVAYTAASNVAVVTAAVP